MNKPVKIAPDKRSIIASALLDGGDLRQRLVDSGVSAAAADYEVKRAEKDPFFKAAARLRRDLAKSHWVLGNCARLERQSRVEPVPTIDRIEPDRFHEDYYVRNRPVKLTGLIDHWPAMRLWTLDYLVERLGEAQVELQGQRESDENYEINCARHRRMLPMRDIVALIRQNESSNEFYVTANNGSTNRRTLAPLWEDLGPVSVLQEDPDRDGFFWLGPKGTLTPLHHDLTNNLLVQVMGRKRVRMIAPWHLPRVRNHLHVFSQWTLRDLQEGGDGVPEQVVVEIGPGDALFLPIGWWHHVEALDPSISMSFTNFPVENDFTAGHPVDPAPAA